MREAVALLAGTANVVPPSGDPVPFRHIGQARLASARQVLALIPDSPDAPFRHDSDEKNAGEWQSPTLDLRGAPLSGLSLRQTYLVGSALDFADLRETDLSESDLQISSFRFADLSDARLSRCCLVDCDFFSANLQAADLSHSFTYDYALDVYPLRNQGHVPTAQPRTDDSGFASANLTDVNFLGFGTASYNFRGATFRGRVERACFLSCDFSRSMMHGTEFSACELEGCCFTGAALSSAQATRTRLTGASFQGADLTSFTATRCDLLDVQLAHADLTEATLRRCRIGGDHLLEPLSVFGLSLEDCNLAGARRFESFVKQEQWLNEYVSAVYSSKSLLRHFVAILWLATSDFGRSVTRLALFATAVVLGYSLAFRVLNVYDLASTGYDPLFVAASAPAVRLAGQTSGFRGLDALHLSLDVFSNLGFSRIEALSPLGAVLIWSEAFLGWSCIASLLTILARRLVPPT